MNPLRPICATEPRGGTRPQVATFGMQDRSTSAPAELFVLEFVARVAAAELKNLFVPVADRAVWSGQAPWQKHQLSVRVRERPSAHRTLELLGRYPFVRDLAARA